MSRDKIRINGVIHFFEEFKNRIIFQDKYYRLHREDDGPAVMYKNGSFYWYKHGKLHRDNGPAIIRRIGTREWYKNDVLHREGAPAIEDFNGIIGDNWWFLNGERHREDGPAAENSNGFQKYYLYNQEYTKEQFERIINDKPRKVF